jgi:hypothetical protein
LLANARWRDACQQGLKSDHQGTGFDVHKPRGGMINQTGSPQFSALGQLYLDLFCLTIELHDSEAANLTGLK